MCMVKIRVKYSSAGAYYFELPLFIEGPSHSLVCISSHLERYLGENESVCVQVRFLGKRSVETKTYGEILRDLGQAQQIAAEARAKAQAKKWAEQRAAEERAWAEQMAVVERARARAEQKAEELKLRRVTLNREFALLFPSADAAGREVFSALDDRISAHSNFTAEYACLQGILLGPHSS
jgi:hypothetical protein